VNSIIRRKNYRKERRRFFHFEDLLLYSTTKRSREKVDKKIKEDEEEMNNYFDNNPFKKRIDVIRAYVEINKGFLVKKISEQGYFSEDIPFQLQDKKGIVTKKAYFCQCKNCLAYFVKFSRKANMCWMCRHLSRKEKQIEQQKIRRTLAKNLIPRYCEHCGELLPEQMKRKNKKYCDISCQQAAYYHRKKIKGSS
jgi:hypothetical protein